MSIRALMHGPFRVGGLLDGDSPSFAYDPRWLATAGAFPASVLMPLEPGAHSTTAVAQWAGPHGGAWAVSESGALEWETGGDPPSPAADAVGDDDGEDRLRGEPDGRPGWVDCAAYGLALAARCGLRVPNGASISADEGGARTLRTPRADRVRCGDGAEKPLHAEFWSTVAPRDASAAEWIQALIGRIDARETLAALDHLLLAALLGDDRFSPSRFQIILAGGPRLAPPGEIGGVGPWTSGGGASDDGRRLDDALGGGVARADKLTKDVWRKFADDAGLNGTFLIERVAALITRARTNALEAERRAAAASGARSALVDYFRRRAEDRLVDAEQALDG